MSKFVKVLLVVLVILFIIGCIVGNSHCASNLCTCLESLLALITGILMNIVHGFTWIVRSISGLL